MKTTVPPEIKLIDIYHAVIPFIIIQLIGLGICLLFPDLITYLPDNFIK
jgi:TRAP-type mannitol/chloroaromatic compound transport system permease large subunit